MNSELVNEKELLKKLESATGSKDVEVTYRNKEALAKVPVQKDQKGTKMSKALEVIKTAIKAGIVCLASNKLLVWIGNLGQDAVIRFLQDKETKFTYGTMKPPMNPNPTLAKFFDFAGDFVSISWASIMAEPMLASVAIAFILTIVPKIIVGIPKYILKKLSKEKGTVSAAPVKSK